MANTWPVFIETISIGPKWHDVSGSLTTAEEWVESVALSGFSESKSVSGVGTIVDFIPPTEIRKFRIFPEK